MRGKVTIKRPPINLDPKYQDPQLTKLINKVMIGGKKETATTIVYSAIERLAAEQKMDVPATLKLIIEKASPILEVKSRRVGGANYQVPMEVRPARKVILVMRWLIAACRGVKGKPMADAMYAEMKNILEDTGAVMKKREDLHKMAEANRAFAHFARY